MKNISNKTSKNSLLATMKPLIIFDLDGTLYNFNNSNSVNFTSSKFYESIKSNAYRFLQSKLSTDLESAKKIYETIKRDFNGEVSLGLEFKQLKKKLN